MNFTVIEKVSKKKQRLINLLIGMAWVFFITSLYIIDSFPILKSFGWPVLIFVFGGIVFLSILTEHMEKFTEKKHILLIETSFIEIDNLKLEWKSIKKISIRDDYFGAKLYLDIERYTDSIVSLEIIDNWHKSPMWKSQAKLNFKKIIVLAESNKEFKSKLNERSYHYVADILNQKITTHNTT